MAAFSAERDSAKMFRASESCSVCLDAVSDSGERAIAKLKCGHHFHLDCIGSAFNAKGAMQCPNCRHVEKGQWLYANGSRLTDDFTMDDAAAYDDEYDVYHNFPHLFPDTLNHFDWCPFQDEGLSPGGSSYQHIQMPMTFNRDGSSYREDDGLARILPEVVVNFSYNYNESEGAASSPPVCPYLRSRLSQGTEESRSQPPPPLASGAHAACPYLQTRGTYSTENSRLQPPVTSGPTRPLDLPSASNNGSPIGSSIGDGDWFSSLSSFWGPRPESFSPLIGNATTLADQIRLTPLPFMGFFPPPPRSGSAPYVDTGLGPSSGSAQERPFSRSRMDAEMGASQRRHFSSPYGAPHGNNESYTDGGSLPVGPCPRPRFAYGQVGNSQSQPQSSSLRSTSMASNRRARHQNGVAAPSIAGGRTDQNPNTGELNRRLGHSWIDLSLSLGSEPPVPAQEPHGSAYQSGDEGFVPYRRESASVPSSPWSPPIPWHPSTRPATGLQPNNRYSHSDFMEGHGSSLGSSQQRQAEQHQRNLLSSFGLDTEASLLGRTSPLPHQLHLPTTSMRWCT